MSTLSLTLKSLPESLLEGLRSAADAAHRSLNKEVIYRLERSFDKPMKTNSDEWDKSLVMEQVAAWENLAGTWESDLSIEAEIEALYAARTTGRPVEL